MRGQLRDRDRGALNMLQAKMEIKKTSRVFLIMQHAGEVCLRLVARVCICQLHPVPREVTRAD